MTDTPDTSPEVLDEVYDTQMAVEANPCGAWQAIQSLAAERDALRAQLAAVRAELSPPEGWPLTLAARAAKDAADLAPTLRAQLATARADALREAVSVCDIHHLADQARRSILALLDHPAPAPSSEAVARAALEWQPIEAAPKDVNILVWYDHDADPYQDPNNSNRITDYAAWTEDGDFLDGKGWAIARWHDRQYGEGYWLPAAWFALENDGYERVCNPTHWMPLPAPPVP
jgi:hypothetical protein